MMKTTATNSHFFKHITCLLLHLAAICLVAVFLCPAAGWAKGSAGPAVVTVGYFYDGDYYYKDENGRYRGYNLEYLYEAAKYTHWIYHFKNYR